MKITKVLLIVLVISLVAIPAFAQGTTYVQTVTKSQPWLWYVSNGGSPGANIKFTVDFTPVKGNTYTFEVCKVGGFNMPTCENNPAYYCYFGGKRDKPGHWECTLLNTQMGTFYRSEFKTSKHDTVVTQTLEVGQ